jgi:hypothetical protein
MDGRDWIADRGRPAVGLQQPPIQGLPGSVSPKVEDDNLPSSSVVVRNCGSIPPLPDTSSRRSSSLMNQTQGQLYLFTLQNA